MSWCMAWFTGCLSHFEAQAVLQMSHTSLPVIRSLWQFGTRGWACAVCLYSRNSAFWVLPWHPSHSAAQPPLPSACPQAAVVQAGSCYTLGKSVFLEEWSLWQVFCPPSGQGKAFSSSYWWNNHGMWSHGDFYSHFFPLCVIIWLLLFFKMCTASN